MFREEIAFSTKNLPKKGFYLGFSMSAIKGFGFLLHDRDDTQGHKIPGHFILEGGKLGTEA